MPALGICGFISGTADACGGAAGACGGTSSGGGGGGGALRVPGPLPPGMLARDPGASIGESPYAIPITAAAA
jgi:hypothetical protein